MIDSARLERNLIAAARRYAPALIPAGWQKPGDYTGSLPNLARALATYNVLVMGGEAPQSAVKGWTDGYQSLYRVLSESCFRHSPKSARFISIRSSRCWSACLAKRRRSLSR